MYNKKYPQADGSDFETKADSVLDFTEGNPFGEFGNLDNLEI